MVPMMLLSELSRFRYTSNGPILTIPSAVGPYATIYAIWKSGALDGAKTPVPIWIL